MSIRFFRLTMVIVCLLALVLFGVLIYVMRAGRGGACPVVSCAASGSTRRPDRDVEVLNNPLYPPVNRSDSETHNAVIRQVAHGGLYQQTNESGDSFRLVGYLTNSQGAHDAGGNNWKLFARMKDRHQGEYYIVPANNNIDLKIPLTSEIVVGEKLRDVYTLPQEMRFKSPMLHETVYVFSELPKGDLGGRYA